MPMRAFVLFVIGTIAALVPSRARGSARDARIADSVSINNYAWYSPSAKTLHVALNASVGGNNGGMNFNGGSRGGATITVPASWKVRMHFDNLDAIPHSAIIITSQDPLPAIPQTPAFAGAYTRDLTNGLATDQQDDLNFTAGAPGNYILLCGVPGHGPSGMWIKFVVAAGAKAPSYTM